MVGGPVDHHSKGRATPSGNAHGSQWLLFAISSWTLWTLPKRGLIAYVLAVDLAAAAGAAWAFTHIPTTGTSLFPTIVLCACTIAYTELSRPIEKIRERFAGIPHIGLDTVWMFAAVLVIQPGLAALVITVSFFYRWLRVQRNPVFRRTFSTAATAISGYAAVAFLWLAGHGSFATMPRSVPTFGMVTAAGLIYLLVNTVLMTIAVYYGASHKRIRDALGSRSDYALEAATIALGILLAWALVDWPIALLLIVGITLVLHRNVLIRQLRAQARTDPKTGLLNITSWSEAATAELDRAHRARVNTSLLMLDLDRFKLINDQFGHLAGDKFLQTVADTLRGEVRASDLVGRFGGEEFVVLLPSTGSEHAHAIAERIRSRIADAAIPLGIHSPQHVGQGTVSIGIAISPTHGYTLDDLLHAADSALYQAKTAGRNRTYLSAGKPPQGDELGEPTAS
ncbi:MAG TPA: diguanylate cyclase [Pseudonocardiaceae bacterium]|nr:diguanylate cyclase [Pseudonocardiaceae bacterium]